MCTSDSNRCRSFLARSAAFSTLATGLALNGAGCPTSGSVLSEANQANGATKPVVTAPADLTVSRDGAGNQAALQDWLASATFSDGCGGATVSDDFAGFPYSSGLSGKLTVTWTVTDRCGISVSDSATFTIIEGPPIELPAPAPITVRCGDPAAADALEAFLAGPAVETDGPLQIASTSTPRPGVRTVTWTGTDPTGGAIEIESSITIVDDTTAPALRLKGNANVTLNCDAQFTDPGVVVEEDCDVLIQPHVDGSVDPRTLGRYTLTYTATDASGNSATPLTRTVTVIAPSEPEIAVNPPIVLWPPNHRSVTFTLADLFTIDGGCAGPLDSNVVGAILSIYSDEPGDDDIVINDAHTFTVVAERLGQGNGRVYGVRFEIRTRESAAPIERIAYIHVPHDQSGRAVIDDGAASGYTVTR